MSMARFVKPAPLPFRELQRQYFHRPDAHPLVETLQNKTRNQNEINNAAAMTYYEIEVGHDRPGSLVVVKRERQKIR